MAIVQGGGILSSGGYESRVIPEESSNCTPKFLKSIDMESVNKKYPYGLMMIRCGKIPMFRQLNNYIISIASSNRISLSPLSH